MSETIFDTATTPAVPAAAPNLQVPDEVLEFIGDGKKYASPVDALKSVPHAQKHISQLETELKEARELLAKAKSAEEVYTTVKEMLAKPERPSGTAPQVSIPDVDTLLDRKLEERERLLVQTQNADSVKQAMLSVYGDKAAEVYRQKAEALGVPVQWLNDVCAKSPNAAFELLGVKAVVKTAPTSTKGSINTEALKPAAPAKPKSVMAGASTTDVIAAWRAAKPQT